jgi:hypothetical protein
MGGITGGCIANKLLQEVIGVVETSRKMRYDLLKVDLGTASWEYIWGMKPGSPRF